MDFEGAAQRLARDHQKLKGRRTVAVSAKAKREADYRKKQQERIRQERQRQQKQTEFVQKYFTASERALGIKQLGSQGSVLRLTPTSIWGEGDKIALPPSVLEFLTQSASGEEMTSSPWMFRIGIVQENYKFPSSPVLQTLKPPSEDDEDEDDDSEDEDETASTTREAYLDELKHRYHAYTHATVVEFTQDEGHVGLPAPIAKALLSGNIATTRTKDPSASSDDNAMQVEDEDDEKTPGHVAYGAFDVPDCKVEITMLRLPKGKHCTLTPTPKAIENGFYNLQNIKLVLEQSLIRTRATLSVGDTVQTWHRGVQFDLTVSEVKPSTFQAVTCINTDIEVEFGQVEGVETSVTSGNDSGTATNSNGRTLSPVPPSGGRTLSSSPPSPGGRTLSSSPPPPTTTTATAPSTVTLLPEPPVDQTDNICTVQIRANQTGRRRFDITKATMSDLFQFASTLTDAPIDQFKLVTRFPRRVFEKTDATMAAAGIQAGQEMIMVERI